MREAPRDNRSSAPRRRLTIPAALPPVHQFSHRGPVPQFSHRARSEPVSRRGLDPIVAVGFDRRYPVRRVESKSRARARMMKKG